MKKENKTKIAVLTCGADAPGMNAVVWASNKACKGAGFELLGIKNGFKGLIEEEIVKLDDKLLESMLSEGGSFLGTSRCTNVKSKDFVNEVRRILKKNEIKGLIICGGKDALNNVCRLSNKDLFVVGIPASIDNDISYSDYAIGFDTACNIGLESVMRLRNSIMSQKCIAIVNVEGKSCGDIAMNVGMASGVDYVMVPEMLSEHKSPYDIDKLFERMTNAWEKGKRYIIIIVAYGVNDNYPDTSLQTLLRERIESYNKNLSEDTSAKDMMSDNIKNIDIGYMQRGGEPNVQDTRLAMEMAVTAVDILADKGTDKLIGIKKNVVFSVGCDEAFEAEKPFDKQMYDRVNSVLTSR